jgi:anti-anti-sigma factor
LPNSLTPGGDLSSASGWSGPRGAGWLQASRAAPRSGARIAELRDTGVHRLILDLRDLYFMDSTGLRCILDCDAAARQDGFAIALIQGPPAVQRVFELTGTTAQLPFIDP